MYSSSMELSEYKERLDNIVINSLVVMTMGVGHRAGLIKAFYVIGRPCTSAELAKQTHLKERYVREWLGCMVAGQIVYINDEDKYYLPADPTWTLTQGHMAAILPMLGAKAPELLKCMDEDGPNGYNYDGSLAFMEWLDFHRRTIDDKWIEENIAPITKLINRDSLTILDFGCGTGRLVIALSKYYPNATIYGIDEAEYLITQSQANAAEQNCKNVTFLAVEGEKLPADYTDKFDLVILYDVLHDLADPQTSVDEVRRILKPDSYMIAFDPAVHSDHKRNVDVPRAGALMTLSLFSCLPCSMSKTPFVGNGIGWGYENRKQFLKDSKFELIPIGDENLEELTFRLTCKKLQ